MARAGLPEGVPRATAPLTFAKGVPFFPLEANGRRLQAARDIGAGFSIVNSAHLEEWLPR